MTEVENAQVCESPNEWEIPTATIKTMTNTDRIESFRSSNKIMTSTKQYTTSITSTSTATYPTSHKSLTKDAQLKHKSRKIPAKQITTSQDQV